MLDNSGTHMVTISPAEEKVFERIASVEQEYEQYLTITENVAVFDAIESPVTPPSPDSPLSLTIWHDM